MNHCVSAKALLCPKGNFSNVQKQYGNPVSYKRLGEDPTQSFLVVEKVSVSLQGKKITKLKKNRALKYLTV